MLLNTKCKKEKKIQSAFTHTYMTIDFQRLIYKNDFEKQYLEAV